VTVDLPYPDKALWPNGRAHWASKHRATAKHLNWSLFAARAAKPRCFAHNGATIPVHIEVQLKPRGRRPDADNTIAAAKAYLDGIAQALGIDDTHFAAPTVSFSAKRLSRFIITVGPCTTGYF